MTLSVVIVRRLGLISAVVLAGCGRYDFEAAADACVAETDTELCEASVGCEQPSLTDRCGAARTVDCGPCAGELACVDHECRMPLCATSGYDVQIVTSLSLPNTEEGVVASSPDGDTLLWVHAPTAGCGTDVVREILDATAPGSMQYVKQPFDAVAVGFIGPSEFVFTADARTLIAPASDHRSFIAATRSGRMTVDFVPSPVPWLAAIAQSIAGDPTAQLGHPALSPDAEAFYYTVSSSTDPTRDGIYEALRANATDAFPAGTRMSDIVQQRHTTVSAVSADHMTLFLDSCPDVASSDCWYTEMLTRRSRNDPFTNPNAPALPPRLPAGPGFTWQHRPTGDCSRIFAVASTGGCAAQDVAVLTRP